MKKDTFKKTGIILILSIVSALYTYFINEKEYSISDLSFSNIEALAAGESGGGSCFGPGSLSCHGGYYKYQFTR